MKDSKQHILAGLLIALAVGLPAYLESLNLFAGLWSAIAGGIIAGGVKEWCDAQYGFGASAKDFGFTCIGIAIAAVFIIMLHFGKG
jgi:hypothetical protein